MKIMQIVAGESTGGTAKHVLELSSELSRSSEVIVVCDQSFKGKLEDTIQHIHFDFSKSTLPATFQLYQIICQIKPDIIHTHGNKASKFAGIIRRFVSIPCIGTIHWHLKKKKEKSFFSRLDLVIGVSDGVLEGVKCKRKVVVHNGIPYIPPQQTKQQIRSKLNLTDSHPVVVAIGRMTKSKGFDILVSAWASINAHLILIGDGPAKPELEAMAKELNIADHVHFLGNIDNATQFFPAIDLVVVSSLHEGFSYVIAEALIHKKPIISTDVTLARQILPSNWVVKASNIKLMREKILSALATPEQHQEDLQEAYGFAENHFTLDKMTESILTCYRQALSDSNSK